MPVVSDLRRGQVVLAWHVELLQIVVADKWPAFLGNLGAVFPHCLPDFPTAYQTPLTHTERPKQVIEKTDLPQEPGLRSEQPWSVLHVRFIRLS